MMNIQLKTRKTAKNCEKSYFLDEKITKKHSTTVENPLQIGLFLQNKPNLPNVQLRLSLFITMIYAILLSLIKVKFKPNQTQYKANSNPISKRLKMNISVYIKEDCEKIRLFVPQKTKPIQSQNKPKFGVIKASLTNNGNGIDNYVSLWHYINQLFGFFNLRGGSELEVWFDITNSTGPARIRKENL